MGKPLALLYKVDERAGAEQIHHLMVISEWKSCFPVFVVVGNIVEWLTRRSIAPTKFNLFILHAIDSINYLFSAFFICLFVSFFLFICMSSNYAFWATCTPMTASWTSTGHSSFKVRIAHPKIRLKVSNNAQFASIPAVWTGLKTKKKRFVVC